MHDESSASRPEPGLWLVDRSRSTIAFRTRNVIGMKVEGRFTDVDGAVEIGDAAAKPTVRVSIPVQGVDSGSRMRDRDLLKKSVFDADQWRDIRFESTDIVPGDHGRLAMNGTLRVRDRTKSIELAATQAESVPGERRYTATCTVNPRDFGITHPFIRRDVEINVDVWLERAGG